MRGLINEIVQKSAQSWFGRWLRLPQMVHATFWLSSLSAVIFLPVFRYVENNHERHRLDTELSFQQQEWDKQEKIFQGLKQKLGTQQLSPELANSVLPINQHVQRLLNGRLRALDLRWDFSQQTLLHLSLQGYFVDLQQFLTALLRDIPILSVTQLSIEKLDEEENASITGELIFQLNKDK